MQEVTLEGLIDKIKSDGVEAAGQKAQEIIGRAQQEAGEIKNQAEREAAEIVARARAEADNLNKNSVTALNQAARDLSLSLKHEIAKLLDAVMKREISRALSADFLKELILKAVEQFSAQNNSGVEIILSREDKEKVEKYIVSKLKGSISDLEIAVGTEIIKGFRIKPKAEEVFYDFSAEAVLDGISQFLSPALNKLLKLEQ